MKIMEMWMDTESKVRVLVFFRENPGVIETMDGLAERLAIPSETLQAEVRDYVQLGLLREREVGDKVLYVFDRARNSEIEEMVEATIRGQEGAA